MGNEPHRISAVCSRVLGQLWDLRGHMSGSPGCQVEPFPCTMVGLKGLLGKIMKKRNAVKSKKSQKGSDEDAEALISQQGKELAMAGLVRGGGLCQGQGAKEKPIGHNPTGEPRAFSAQGPGNTTSDQQTQKQRVSVFQNKEFFKANKQVTAYFENTIMLRSANAHFESSHLGMTIPNSWTQQALLEFGSS